MVRWHHDFGIGLFGQYGMGHWPTIEGTIPHEDIERGFNLVEKTGHGSRVSDFRRSEFTGQNLVVFIDR